MALMRHRRPASKLEGLWASGFGRIRWRLRPEPGKRAFGLAALQAFKGLRAGKGNMQRSKRWLRPRPTKSSRIYGQIGNLQVRLARTTADVRMAQRLRYDVFYREMSAVPNITAQFRQRDEDPYDAVCDHLLVFDSEVENAVGAGWSGGRKPRVVGTYRVLRQEVAERNSGFYTQGEYDIAPLLAARAEDPQLHGAWPQLRAEALSQQAHRRTAVARLVDLCASSIAST